MNNYIVIDGQRMDITPAQANSLLANMGINIPKERLSDIQEGEIVRISDVEFVVLEQMDGCTALICKNPIGEDSEFGENNNFAGSYVDDICQSFSEHIALIAGEENLLTHTVDLTTDDGLKDYGAADRRISLLTADQYRKYVDVLDKHNPKVWWWLATAHSTERHENNRWVKCVSPSGCIVYGGYFSYGVGGVRPFCILKSNIFVSC